MLFDPLYQGLNISSCNVKNKRTWNIVNIEIKVLATYCCGVSIQRFGVARSFVNSDV